MNWFYWFYSICRRAGHVGLRTAWLRSGVMLLACTSCVQVPVETPQDIRLASLFSDNMVLQRGAWNNIYGWSAPGTQIWVAFRSVSASARADRTGAWTVRLDLRTVLDSVPAKLAIGEGKERRVARIELTNVVAGDVWVLGVSNGRGVPLQPTQSYSLDRPNIRFVTITDLSLLREPSGQTRSPWRIYSAESIRLQELPAISFYFARALNVLWPGQRIGIIHTDPGHLTAGLREGEHLQDERREFLNKISSCLYSTWYYATNEVQRVEELREQQLIDAKVLGIVTDPPPILPYLHFPTARLREQFDPAKIPAIMFTFEGAVW